MLCLHNSRNVSLYVYNDKDQENKVLYLTKIGTNLQTLNNIIQSGGKVKFDKPT